MLRSASSFLGLVKLRRRAEPVLVRVVTEARPLGVSTRLVEASVQMLGIEGRSKPDVSWLCGVLDEQVSAFRVLRMLLTEQSDEWRVGHHSFSEASMRQRLEPSSEAAA